MVLKYAKIMLEATVLQMTGNNTRSMPYINIVEPLYGGLLWDIEGVGIMHNAFFEESIILY